MKFTSICLTFVATFNHWDGTKAVSAKDHDNDLQHALRRQGKYQNKNRVIRGQRTLEVEEEVMMLVDPCDIPIIGPPAGGGGSPGGGGKGKSGRGKSGKARRKLETEIELITDEDADPQEERFTMVVAADGCGEIIGTQKPTVSSAPSTMPTSFPSVSVRPSFVPSGIPSISSKPSQSPTMNPSLSVIPTTTPTSFPSVSVLPSSVPSGIPSISSKPSQSPTMNPSLSVIPTSGPSQPISSLPSISTKPSTMPSLSPSTSAMPSQMPSTCADSPERIWCFANVNNTWTEHENTAVGLCGHLVSINDTDTNGIIKRLPERSVDEKQRFWIGLECDPDQGCTLANATNWTWTNGLAYNYPDPFTNWEESEPNNLKGHGESCVEMQKNHKWNDQQCTDKITAVYDLPLSSLCKVDDRTTTTCYSATTCTATSCLAYNYTTECR